MFRYCARGSCNRRITARAGSASARCIAGLDVLNKIDDVYAWALHAALKHRPTVFATGIALFVLSIYLIRFIGVELQPTTDEGEVTVDELAVGTRVEVTEGVLLGLEQRIRELFPR